MTKVSNSADSYHISELAASIQKHVPKIYFGAVIGIYIINAIAVTCFTVPALSPKFGTWGAILLMGFTAFSIQVVRFLIVFSSQLLPDGYQSKFSKFSVHSVAFILTGFAVYEAIEMAASIGLEGASLNLISSVFITLVVGGYILEISFVGKLDRWVKMSTDTTETKANTTTSKGRKKASKGMGVPAVGKSQLNGVIA